MRADDEFDDVDERKSQCNFAIIRREEVESLTRIPSSFALIYG